MDSWLEYLDITQHPYLDRFENGDAVELMYEGAVYGLSPLYYGRPENWYGRAKHTAHALERIGEMTADRIEKNPNPDLFKVLEDCEEPESIDLIEKIFLHFKEAPHQSKTVSATSGQAVLASEKQRGYLRKLGVKNFSGTKSEASQLIDQLVAGSKL